MTKRFKTQYPGVTYRLANRIGGSGTEKVFYVTFRKNGKLIEQKVGRQFSDAMTPARANRIRAELIDGRRKTRQELKAERLKQVWTFDLLFHDYCENERKAGNALSTDKGRYKNYIQPFIGGKQPLEIDDLDIQKIRRATKHLSPQTQKHVLNRVTQLSIYGVKYKQIKGIQVFVKKPSVDNKVTEFLTEKQLQALMRAIEQDTDINAMNMMKLALFSGLRRGEMIKLRWSDIDFEQGFIKLRDTKSGKDKIIPLNALSKEVLWNHPRTLSQFVFPGLGGKQRQNTPVGVRRIASRAGLPEGFRPLHGLRHTFASLLASSGEVDLYTISKLLTHADSKMTERYSHLRDEALKKASSVMDKIMKK